MADYTKTTNFLAKDSLPLNNAAKYVKGSEIDTEFNNIATADADNLKVSALGTGVETFLGTPSSANLAAAITDETGTGVLVFATSPTLVTPLLGTPTSGVLTNCTGTAAGLTAGVASAVAVGGITGLGTNVATALAVNVGSAGAPVVLNGALGAPSSGNLANCTGYPSSITLGTPQASTSGTSIDFTGIPAGVKRITVTFDGVSTNGTDQFLFQIGDSGGVETTGYKSSTINVIGTSSTSSTSTAGFIAILTGGSATNTFHGAVTITRYSASHAWVAVGALCVIDANTGGSSFSGSKTLSEELDRVRITTTGGTNTFDAGTINIIYE